MKNKILIITLFIIALISALILFSGYNYFDEPESFRSSYSGESGWFPFLIIYNGSYSFVDDFYLLNFEEREMGFFLTFVVSFPGYNDAITVDVSNEQENYPPYFPENPGDSKGIYIMDLKLKQSGDLNRYPFDEHEYKVSFKGDDYKLQFPRINQNHSLQHWRLTVYGDANYLNFSFSRVQEISSYRILKFVGSFSCFFGIISILIFFYILKSEDDKKCRGLLGEFPFYLSNIIGIPFYFGVIVNFMLYQCPDYNSKYISYLIFLLLLSIFVGCISFFLRKKVEDERERAIFIKLEETQNLIDEKIDNLHNKIENNNDVFEEKIKDIGHDVKEMKKKFPKRKNYLFRHIWKRK